MAYNCIKNGSECDGCEQCKTPISKCPCCARNVTVFMLMEIKMC